GRDDRRLGPRIRENRIELRKPFGRRPDARTASVQSSGVLSTSVLSTSVLSSGFSRLLPAKAGTLNVGMINRRAPIGRQLGEEVLPFAAFARRDESKFDQRIVKLIGSINLRPHLFTNALDR